MSKPDRKLRWSKFWWGDWQNDSALKMCSYAARGLWIEMLAIMHAAEPQGHLLVNSRAPSPRQIAALTGGVEKEVVRNIAELEEAGVFSRTEAGVIYSRRMLRDYDASIDASTSGLMGGNPEIRRGSVAKDDRVRPFKRSDAPRKTERIFEKSGGNCHWCGVQLQRDVFGPDFFHVDHVVPVCDGGDNNEANLVAACAACNHKRARVDWSEHNPTATGLSVGNTSALKLEEEAEEEREEERKKDPPTPRSRGAVRGKSGLAGFEEFWRYYPRRVGKGEAEKAWPNAVAQAGGDPSIVSDGLKCRLHIVELFDPRDEGRFIPHPATWLRRRGWEDAIPGLEPGFDAEPSLPFH